MCYWYCLYQCAYCYKHNKRNGHKVKEVGSGIRNGMYGRLGGFPGGLDGKESALNAGNLGSFSGSGRSSEKGMATHSSILAWRVPWTEAAIHGVAKS